MAPALTSAHGAGHGRRQPGAARILEALDTGLYIGNLWYLNYWTCPPRA